MSKRILLSVWVAALLLGVFSPAFALSFDKEWDSYPSGTKSVIKLDRPLAIALSNGKIYVADLGHQNIVVYKTDGTHQKTISLPPDTLNALTDIAVDSKGKILLSNPSYAIIEARTSTGALARLFGGDGKIGSEGQGAEDQNRGWKGIAVDSNNEVFAVDPNNKRVKKFFTNGAYAGVYGDISSSRLNTPKYIAYDGSVGEYVYVTDGDRIVKIPTGFGYGTEGTDIVTGLTNASFISIKSGKIVVLDDNKIKSYDKNGRLQYVVNAYGQGAGKYSNPVGIITDKDGNVFVLDKTQEKIIKFKK